MNKDVCVFLIMVLCGGGISCIFDLFRAFRIEVKPPAAIVYISDVLFCALSFFAMVACVWNFNSGEVRFFEITGLALGAVFYFLLLSKWILKFFLFIIKNILKFIRFILKILLTPSRFLYKILIVPICKHVGNMRQRGKTHVKRIQRKAFNIHKAKQKEN